MASTNDPLEPSTYSLPAGQRSGAAQVCILQILDMPFAYGDRRLRGGAGHDIAALVVRKFDMPDDAFRSVEFHCFRPIASDPLLSRLRAGQRGVRTALACADFQG